MRSGYNAAYSILSNKYYLSKSNYKINLAKYGASRFTNYIYCQKQYTWYKKIKIGEWGNLYDNGCGIIALYNIMLRVSGRANLAGIIVEAELNNMLVLKGALGVDFEAIGCYLKEHCINHKKILSYSDFKRNMPKYSSAILYVRNSNSLSRHYFVVIKVLNKYYSINQYNNVFEIIPININNIKNFKGAYCITYLR